MNKLLQDLNAAQKKAVIHKEGPLLIIAGAGTGKTKVITHRIAYLISSKSARPEEILAVTFTEKAAGEMEERVDRLIPYSYSFVDISTFNSFGEQVLRNHIHELGYPLDFQLMDEVEQSIFFREKLFRFPLKYFRPLTRPTRHIQEILAALRRCKQEDITPDEYVDFARRLKIHAGDAAEKEMALKHQEMALVYKTYQRLLRKEGKTDFEDQVALAVDLFRRRPSVLKEYQNKFKYILVDEFQDTNHLQFEMLKLLAGKHRSITVVGDDDQSIFRFRGASLSNILNFRKLYPDADRVVINQNYRSTQDILDSAYKLIQHNNPDRLEKEENINKSLESRLEYSGKSIFKLQFDTLSHEADRVAEIILEKAGQGYRFGDMAVLVRRNADADPFLRAMNLKEIPYRFSGSRGLYSQTEIKVLIAFIKAATDFEDSRSLFHLSLSEIYRVDPYDLTKISNYAYRKNASLHSVFRKLPRVQPEVGVSEKSLKKIKSIIKDLLFFVDLSAVRSAGRVVYGFLEKSGYLKSLVEKQSPDTEIKIKNIRLFFDKIQNFSGLTEDDSLQSFARHLDLLQQVGDNPATAEAELEEDAVQVLTVHKAKGLEFSIVFMVSLIGDRFPGRRRREIILFPDGILQNRPRGKEYRLDRDLDKIMLQEERRLFYVGMTRAKRMLYLTWGRDYGVKRLKKVSPFILEALDLSRPPRETLRSSPLEEIERYAPKPPSSRVSRKVAEPEIIPMSYYRVADYLTCPLKFRFRHVVQVPVPPHYNLVYGRVLHDTIHFYLLRKKSGVPVAWEDILREYRRRWVNEGFLSREHEEMKKSTGERALRRFYMREEQSGARLHFLEKKFKWREGSIKFSGRWDRVDKTKEGAVIIDFKSTPVRDQKEADSLTRESLQMDLYALSFLKTQKLKLFETRLYFLESGILGRAQKGKEDMERARKKIREAEAGVRKNAFPAAPDWHNCSTCDFRSICPSSYAY
ncbi:MAG: ATP-dependent DNA helicase [Candidatus Aminicenantes bacterium]